MRKVLLLALNDLRLTVRDRWAFFWMLVLPLSMTWLFGQMGGGRAESPKVTLTVVDRDGGWVARALVSELKSAHNEIKEVAPGMEETTEHKVRTLVLPEGFTRKVLAGEQQKLRLVKEEGAAQDYSRAAEVQIVRAITRTLARLVEMRGQGAGAAAGQAGAAEAGAGADRAAEFARLQERPPLVHLEVTTAGRGRPVPAGMAQSVPGILTMTVLMMTAIYGGVFLTIEKRVGMLRRQVSLPVGRTSLIAGKVLGRLFVAALQIAVLLLAGRFLFGLDFGASPLGLLSVLLCYAFAVAGLSTLLGAVLKSPEQASSIGWIASMVMGAMGGCWWPSEVAPRWLWRAAHVFPTTWAMDAFHQLISFGYGLGSVLWPCAALLGFGVLFTALGARYLNAAVA